MIHQNVIECWAYEHYLIYLYLCIADSDGLIEQKELDIICSNVCPSLGAARVRQLIKEVYIEYLAHTEEEIRKYIKENAARYLRTDVIRKKVLEHLKTLVDDEEGCEEQAMFAYIKNSISPGM
ncbi:MAG: hypothetical protein NZ529_10495 [Cytophagaceae bacterium]|nr:hypothetical protein [Cytophagaceae bacterium]MDW8457215.1 hypothetical protein [Cytophagaceae bacterium]